MKPNPAPRQTPAVSSTKYRAHRERQRRRILTAAQELFNANGIDRVTMAEIVNATGVRPSTVYEYFTNKDAIVGALIEECLVQSSEYLRTRFERAEGPALAKITAIFDALGDELVSHPERVRFHAQFDAMYARDWTAEMLLAIEERAMPHWSESFADPIREGIKDGSLCSDLDPDLTMGSIINAALATQRRFAALGTRVEKEYGKSSLLLFREASRLILLGLRNPATQQPATHAVRSRRKVQK